MTRVVAIAEVEDVVKWEEGFRTHGELFKSQTVKNCEFTVAGDKRIILCFEVSDLGTYLRVLDSPETADAMAFDGVKRETVQIFPLDKHFTP